MVYNKQDMKIRVFSGDANRTLGMIPESGSLSMDDSHDILAISSTDVSV